MHASYDDIISRINAPPIWFDEHAVPRYCAFEPARSACIGIGEIALVEITCQHCGHRFQVALSAVNFGEKSIADAIRDKTLHFGDPPRHDRPRDACTGSSMNSEPRRVLEYWRRHDKAFVEGGRITSTEYFTWKRDQSLEIDVQPKWVTVR